MEFNFEGKVSLDDYIQFNQFVSKKYEIIFHVILLFCVLINLSINIKSYYDGIIFGRLYENNLVLTENEETNLEELQNSIKIIDFAEHFLSSILLIIFFTIFLFIRKHNKSKRIMKNYNSNKLMTENNVYKITIDSIIINNDFGNITLKERIINKILYDKDSIYIFIGLNAAYIIKKHFFEDENKYYELNNFIKEKYGKK